MKLDFLWFFISSFACYRLTVLISRDLISKPIRTIPYIGKVAKCPYCTSVYMGSLVTVELWISGFVMPWPMWIILSFAFSASSIILDRIFSADYAP